MFGPVPYDEWLRRDPLRIPMEVDDPIAVGTEVAVYGQRVAFGTVVDGPNDTALGVGACYEVLVGDLVHRWSHFIVRPRDDAEKAWHVIREGRIAGGGPRITRQRCEEIAARDGGEVVQGLPEAVLAPSLP